MAGLVLHEIQTGLPQPDAVQLVKAALVKAGLTVLGEQRLKNGEVRIYVDLSRRKADG